MPSQEMQGKQQSMVRELTACNPTAVHGGASPLKREDEETESAKIKKWDRDRNGKHI